MLFRSVNFVNSKIHWGIIQYVGTPPFDKYYLAVIDRSNHLVPLLSGGETEERGLRSAAAGRRHPVDHGGAAMVGEGR